MAGAGGLAVVLLAGLIGFVLVVTALGLIIYGLRTANARRGYRASVVALVFSLIAALLSYPFWEVVLSGRDTHGQPINYGELGPILPVLTLEVLAAGAAAWGVIKQKRRLARG